MKNGLGNLAAADADQLTAIINNRLKIIQYRPELIDGPRSAGAGVQGDTNE